MRDIKIVGYLSAEFLIGPQLGNNLLNLGIREPVKQALAELGLDLEDIDAAKSRSRGWATAAWAGWPPATWIRWPLCAFRQSDTAFATSSGCSTRRSATAGRWRRPTNGCSSAIPGRSAGRRFLTSSAIGGHTEQYHDEQGNSAGALGPGQRGERRCPRHADRRLRYRHDEFPPAVGIGGGRVFRLAGLQRWRLLQGGAGESVLPRPSAKCSIPTTSPRRASGCAWRSSISSPPARCRT